jgi:hypothetical protein
MNSHIAAASLLAFLATTAAKTPELIFRKNSEYVVLEGHDVPESYHSPLPYT